MFFKNKFNKLSGFKDKLVCAVCEGPIQTDDYEALRTHLITSCISIPYHTVDTGDRYEVSRRVAALSSIYKINDGVRIRQRLSSTREYQTGEQLSEDSGERHTAEPTNAAM